MIKTSVSVDRRRVHGRVQPWVYGQFLEHIGRAIYGGVWEPGSPLADSDGYRKDVLEVARELGPTVLRWPGGNFASGYHWRDGVGPREERPTRRDLAWNALESNQFGTEEFLELCRRLGVEPYVNLNVSTGSVDEALGWLEYCNAADPLPEVRVRAAGPHPDPHNVSIWGLGNENYGWWQHGHSSAESYGEIAREWSKLLRWADPRVTLVGVGSPSPDWNWKVLNTAGQFIDLLSLHFYWHEGADRYHSVLAGPVAAERSIEANWGLSLAAQSALGLKKPIRFAVDEWNVWTHTITSPGTVDNETLMRLGFSARTGIDTRFEEAYDLRDALTVATWLHVMWRHPEKLGLATQAQMVNVIAPILTGPEGLVRQTIFHPLALARRHGGDVSLDVLVECDEGVPAPGVVDGSMAAVDAGALLDPATGGIYVSVVNRSQSEEVAISFDGIAGTAKGWRLFADDPHATNTLEAPERVIPEEISVDLGAEVVLPPHSHLCFTI